MKSIHEIRPLEEVVVILHCPLCGADRQAKSPIHDAYQTITCICDPCQSVRDAAVKPAETEKPTKLTRDQQRTIDWSRFCPTEFRLEAEGGKTIEERLNEVPAVKLDVMQKHYGKSVLLHGPTGASKTRVAWRIVKQHYDFDESIEAFTCSLFATAFQSASGVYRADEFLKQLIAAKLFFVDDIGKTPWTANVWGAFFAVVDARVAWYRRTVLTSNFGIAAIKQLMLNHAAVEVQGMAGPLASRLHGSFTSIEMKVKV